MIRFLSAITVLVSSVTISSAFTPSFEISTRVTPSSTGTTLFKTPAFTVSSTALQSSNTFTQAELPDKLYFKKEKEVPKVLGGLQIGLRKLVVITGASSGLGLNCAATLAKTGRYFVVMAVRDIEKGKQGKSRTPSFEPMNSFRATTIQMDWIILTNFDSI